LDVETVKILFALILINLLAIAPILAWRKTRNLTLPVLAIYGAFILIHWDFIIGNEVTYHDTAWTLESWTALMQQWIDSGVSLGWNPYWGAGQPFSLYNNISDVIPMVAFAYLFKALGLKFTPLIFFNLIWLFGYLNICTGSLLLFRLVYKKRLICLLGFFTLLFGGLFYSDAGEPLGAFILSFLPYLVFLIIIFYKTQDWRALLFFLLY